MPETRIIKGPVGKSQAKLSQVPRTVMTMQSTLPPIIICHSFFENKLATAAGSVSSAITNTMPTMLTSNTMVTAVRQSVSR